MIAVADPEVRGAAAPPIGLTNFCINVKSNPRMHQNPPFSGKNSIFFLGRGHSPLPRPLPLDRPPPIMKFWIHHWLIDGDCVLIRAMTHVSDTRATSVNLALSKRLTKSQDLVSRVSRVSDMQAQCTRLSVLRQHQVSDRRAADLSTRVTFLVRHASHAALTCSNALSQISHLIKYTSDVYSSSLFTE